jgi:hypothetical protein
MTVENPNFLLQAILYNIERLFWLEIRGLLFRVIPGAIFLK